MNQKARRSGVAQHLILLVENELTVALEMEVALREEGVCDVRIAGNEDAARDILASNPVLSGAILDVNLSGGTSLELAEELVARGVPVAFATGYDATSEQLARYPDIPVISKPFGRHELIAAVNALLSRDRERRRA